MSVKLRLKRFGRRNRAFFRLCATDTRNPRDGKTLETLGYYDPVIQKESEGVQLKLDAERIQYWLSVGAQPSETVRTLLKKGGIALPLKKARKRKGRSKGAPVAASKGKK